MYIYLSSAGMNECTVYTYVRTSQFKEQMSKYFVSKHLCILTTEICRLKN